MSGINEIRESPTAPQSGGGIWRGLIGLLRILIGLLLPAVMILIGLLLFLPPETAFSFFDNQADKAGFQDLHCPALTGAAVNGDGRSNPSNASLGDGSVRPAAFGDGSVRPSSPGAGAGSLLPAVQTAGFGGGIQSCFDVFRTGAGGGPHTMSFFGCQNNLRTSIGLGPMSFDSFCSSAPSTAGGGLCGQQCDPNNQNACGDAASGLKCTKENGGYFCDGQICRQPTGGTCGKTCNPAAANACAAGFACKPADAAGSVFTCQSPNCPAPGPTKTPMANPPCSTATNPNCLPPTDEVTATVQPPCDPAKNPNCVPPTEQPTEQSTQPACDPAKDPNCVQASPTPNCFCEVKDGGWDGNWVCSDANGNQVSVQSQAPQCPTGGGDSGGKKSGGNPQCSCVNGVNTCTGIKCNK